MRRAVQAALICLLLLGAFAAARADDFWKKKPASKWTVEEALKILQDSPWAKQQLMASAEPEREADARITNRPEDCDPDAIDPNGNCLQRRITLPRDPSQSRSVNFSNSYYAIYGVRWESAAVVKQAFARLEELGAHASAVYLSPPPRLPDDRYVVTLRVMRPPRDNANPFAERADSKEQHRVRLKTSRGEFSPSETERPGVEANTAVYYYFPRLQNGAPIVGTRPETVEFVFDGERLKLKAKFTVAPEPPR